MIEEVFSEEKVPVDIQKITAIQTATGAQYLTRTRFLFCCFDTKNWSLCIHQFLSTP